MKYTPAICSLLLLLSWHNANAQSTKYFDACAQRKDVSAAAKDYYSGKLRASDDDKTFSIFDSLGTRNNDTRPFYIYLVSRIIKNADGALSEAAGVYCKSFLENHPDQLLAFLYSDNNIDTKLLRANWASMIASEYGIGDCPGAKKDNSDYTNAEICLSESKKTTLKNCSEKYASNASAFFTQMETALKKYK